MSERKNDHISLSHQSQTHKGFSNALRTYEPLIKKRPKTLSPHNGTPDHEEDLLYQNPKWLEGQRVHKLMISSMTGGADQAFRINHRLFELAHKKQMLMGLGSMRKLYAHGLEQGLESLKDHPSFKDFSFDQDMMKKTLIFANLGIAQIHQIVQSSEYQYLEEFLDFFRLKGLIIHINPIQEIYQPEGDVMNFCMAETLEKFRAHFNSLLYIKEVGTGLGPQSLQFLIDLAPEVIDLSLYGGTNFGLIEKLRSQSSFERFGPELHECGVDFNQMLSAFEEIRVPSMRVQTFVISGGVRSMIQAQAMEDHLRQTSGGRGQEFFYAWAYPFLVNAMKSKDALFDFLTYEENQYRHYHDYFPLRSHL